MVISLATHEAPLAVDVLCDAFHDYPVMRHVLGPGGDYDARLKTLVGMFVAARVLREEPVLAVRDGGEVVAVAIVTLPGSRPSPQSFLNLREAVFRELGDDARIRYEAYGAVASTLLPTEPQHHLNMIGVRHTHMGRGLARILLEAVHDLARADKNSAGVSLSTELKKNVALYEYFGYTVIGHARVTDDLETWGFFRRHA